MTHGPPGKRKSNGNNGTENDVDIDDQLPIPPDGGWGWVVAFASFMIHIVTDGITYSFGVLYNEFLTYFGEGKGYTAWIASLLVGVTLCSGPISSSFVNRYGCRAVTIAGAILAAVCIFLSIFAQNVLTLIFTIGIGAGFGFGLIYLPAIVSVTTYFEKYRSLATGIAVCGSGLGTFIFAPLIEVLIGSYGWRGAMLILSAIVLNCIIFGVMFRPLEAPSKKLKCCPSNHSNVTELQPLNNKKNDLKNTLEIPQRNDAPIIGRSRSIGFDMANNGVNKNGHANGGVSINIVSSKNAIRATLSQPQMNQGYGSTRAINRETRDKSGSGTMYRPDALYQGSLVNIAQYRSRTDLSKNCNDQYYDTLKRVRGSTNIDDDVDLKMCGCIPCTQETYDTFTEMMNFSLFRDTIFILFTFSNFCTSIGFNIPYVYLPSYAESLGLTKEEGSYLLAIIGIGNTIGRIVLGYFADKPFINRLLVYNICLTLCGISTAFSVFCDTFVALGIYACVFGFTIGAYVGLTSVILVDLFGLEKLTNAFGLLLLVQGIASLVGPPIGGLLYDYSESYTPAFLLGGLAIAISGVVLFLIPIIQNYRSKQESLNSNNQQPVLFS